MHRIMADLMSKDYEVVTRPSEENYCMHVPDGATGNASRAGMLGTFGRIYHNHRCTAKLANSGSFLRHIEYNESLPATSPELYQQGAKFTVEPDSIQDYAGADVVDAVNPMGGELPWVIGRYRTVRTPGATGGGNYKWTNQPKIATLEHAADFNASYGYKAIMVFCEGTTGTSIWNIFFSIMANKRRDVSAPDTSWPYVWQEPFEPTTAPNSMASSFASTLVVKAIDLVEFDDGSLFLVVASDKTNILYVECFRSFDYGVNWHYVGDVITPTSQTNVYLHSVAIERINERLVVAYCYSYSSGINRLTVGTVYYSDDFGQQWTAASDNFSFNYAVAQNSVANCVELVCGRDQVLYLGYIRDTLANANGTPYIRFRRTMDGDNLSSEVDSGLLGKSFGFFEDSAGVWQMYYREWNVGAAGDGELTVAFNLSDPNTAAWTADAQQHFLTMNSIETTNSIWDHVAVAPIDNCMFIDVLGVFLSSSNVAFKTTVNEFKVQMWSGLTSYEEMDYTWHACRNPSTSDPEPNIHMFTRATGGTYTTALTWDATALRSYLRLTAAVGGVITYETAALAGGRTNGFEIRTSFRVNSGQMNILIHCDDGAGNYVWFILVFDAEADVIQIWDGYKGGGSGVVDTFTPSNWSVKDWNTYHILFIDDEVHVYRAPEQFSELLPFELTTTFDGIGTGALVVSEEVQFGLWGFGPYGDAASVDIESFSFLSGVSWTAADMPIDQDTDLLGKRCYFYPLGLYGGMSTKFDGTFGVAGDSWTVETGAIYEMENIFNPSPSICWKSSAYVKGVAHGTEPNEVMTWKQADDYAGEDVRQTVQGFAVFGRNWPFCKLEGSNDGSSFDTLFDSYATQTLAYLLKFTVNGNAVDNRVVVTIPAGMPPLHVNRFASTPEIKYYLMATTGDVRYYVYEILENDATSFYLRGNVNGDIANAATVVVFSDRFYYDFSVRDVVNHADGDIYGDTTFTGYQYEYYRLTVYGLVTEAGPSYRNIVFPDSDDGLKRIGSVHLGRVYDLPHEEWEISCGLQPMMSVTESKTGRKEYRRIGVAKRMIGLNYTGLVERGFGINPVVDLNRALGWGENPLVFVDDADVLQYGDAAPSTFGSYTHQNPVLARMIDGYQMSRVAFTYESENQGDETMLLTRDIVNVSGIKLEEVI